MTQNQLANALNVSQNAVYNWENGKREPSIDMIKKIAKVFNFPLYLLLDDNFELENVELEMKRTRPFKSYEMTEPPGPFTVPLTNSSIKKYDATVEITPEAMDRLKEDAEAREILKKYESGEKILESEYKKVIE